MSKKGFSLIETLLYLAILSVVGALMTGILTNVVRINIQETSGNEVTSQLNSVMQNINSLVRQSSYIEIATSTTVTTLKLRMYDKAKDPTCVYISSNVIKLAQGPDSVNPQNCTSATSDLTTSKVTADRLNFQKITYYPGHDTVSVDIQLSYNSTNPQAQISRALQTTIGRVSAATFDDNLIPGTNNTFDLGLSGSSWRNAYFSGNVGIGTTAPGALLEVGTNVAITSPRIKVIGYSDAVPLQEWGDGGVVYTRIVRTANNTMKMTQANYGGVPFIFDGTYSFSGNVGIGTTGPGAKLEANLGTTGGLPATSGSTQPNASFRVAGSNTGTALDFGVDGAVTAASWIQASSQTNHATNWSLLLNPNGGNVGIGTTGPGTKLQINHDGASAYGMALRLFQSAVGNSDGTKIEFFKTMTASKAWNAGILNGVNVADFAISEDGGYASGFGTPRLTIQAGGNVGIGTTSPGTNINSGSSYFRPDPSGKLLDVYSANNESVLNLISNQDASGAHLGGIYFTRSAGATDAHMNVAGIQGRQSDTGIFATGLYAGGELWFFAKKAGFGAEIDEARMVIKNTGNVGIGITTPSEKLDVRGNIKLHSDGSLYAPGGVENLRIIRGTVNGDGTINQGSGFTVNNPSTGVFDINFTTAFSIKPTVVCSGMHPTDGANTDGVIQCLVNHPNQITTTVARLIITDGANVIRNSPYSFIAIGPR